MRTITRRRLLQFGLGTALVTLPGVRHLAHASAGRVAIIGGGAAGTVAARYVRAMAPGIEVILIEPKAQYYTAFMSSGVVSGARAGESIRFDYARLERAGVRMVRDAVRSIDAAGRALTLQGGERLAYDRLIVAAGIGLRWDAIDGYDEQARQRMPHAWQDGQQCLELRRQLEQMKSGGTVVIAAPADPCASAAAPYERASHIAWFLKERNPRAKVLLLDAKDRFEQQELFTQAWKERYPGMIEWLSGGVRRVDARAMKLDTGSATYLADVACIIPPQRAAELAVAAELADTSGWCPVDVRTFESTRHAGVHVVGDAAATGMPKSAQAANSQAKACAAAVVALLEGREPPSDPRFLDVQYSLVAPDHAFSTAAVYGPAGDHTRLVAMSGGASLAQAPPAHRAREALYAQSWFNNITHEMFG